MFCPPQACKIKPLSTMRVHEIFRFAGLLPIGAGFAKRNDAPQCPPQAKNFWDLGGVLYKKHEPPGGKRPPQAENFWAFGGRCTQKLRCWDAFRNVFLAQNTPQNPQNFRLQRAKSPNDREKPPPCCQSGNNKGGGFPAGGVFLADMD